MTDLLADAGCSAAFSPCLFPRRTRTFAHPHQGTDARMRDYQAGDSKGARPSGPLVWAGKTSRSHRRSRQGRSTPPELASSQPFFSYLTFILLSNGKSARRAGFRLHPVPEADASGFIVRLYAGAAASGSPGGGQPPKMVQAAAWGPGGSPGRSIPPVSLLSEPSSLSTAWGTTLSKNSGGPAAALFGLNSHSISGCRIRPLYAACAWPLPGPGPGMRLSVLRPPWTRRGRYTA